MFKEYFVILLMVFVLIGCDNNPTIVDGFDANNKLNGEWIDRYSSQELRQKINLSSSLLKYCSSYLTTIGWSSWKCIKTKIKYRDKSIEVPKNGTKVEYKIIVEHPDTKKEFEMNWSVYSSGEDLYLDCYDEACRSGFEFKKSKL